jgi:hypothetical protein
VLVVVASMSSRSLPDRGTAVGAEAAAEGTPVAGERVSAGWTLGAHAATPSRISAAAAATRTAFCTTAHNGRQRDCVSSIGGIAEVHAEALGDLLVQTGSQRFEPAHQILCRGR